MSRSAAIVKRVQYAALPYRLMGRSRTEVMLVTSRDTRRWIIPKGWPQKGRAPHHSAAREAFEEAGVEGVIDSRPVGTFYQKRLKNGGVVDCEVEVYALRAATEQAVAGKRRAPVKWVSAQEAAETVREPKLSTIIRRWAPKSGD
jgi:8-oxo-dGTP pyrophosphatase MutT (NUDIX family)